MFEAIKTSVRLAIPHCGCPVPWGPAIGDSSKQADRVTEAVLALGARMWPSCTATFPPTQPWCIVIDEYQNLA